MGLQTVGSISVKVIPNTVSLVFFSVTGLPSASQIFRDADITIVNVLNKLFVEDDNKILVMIKVQDGCIYTLSRVLKEHVIS